MIFSSQLRLVAALTQRNKIDVDGPYFLRFEGAKYSSVHDYITVVWRLCFIQPEHNEWPYIKYRNRHIYLPCPDLLFSSETLISSNYVPDDASQAVLTKSLGTTLMKTYMRCCWIISHHLSSVFFFLICFFFLSRCGAASCPRPPLQSGSL